MLIYEYEILNQYFLQQYLKFKHHDLIEVYDIVNKSCFIYINLELWIINYWLNIFI